MANKYTIDDEELKSICLNNSQESTGSEYAQDILIQDRRKALDYYFGRPRGDEVVGNSQVISMDLQNSVDSILSQAMPSLMSPDLVQFEPLSEEDEEQARLESSFVNNIVMDKNNGYILMEESLKDVLLSKNCIAKVSVDIKEDTEKERYKGLSPEEIAFVLTPTAKNQEIDVSKFDADTGTVNLKRITTTRKLDITTVAPENFGVLDSHTSPYLKDCNYCRERYFVTRSDLVEQGYDMDLIYGMPSVNYDTNEDALARNTINYDISYDQDTPSLQILEIEEHYINIDRDGDGVAELYKVLTCENNLIDIEEAECIPYANGLAWLNGHRFYGLSAYDKLKQVQDAKTTTLRQMQDNAEAGNHQKENVVEDMVEMDDFLGARHNAIRRVQSQDAAMVIPHNDVTPSCIALLDYWDKQRTEATGSSLDLQSNQMNMPSNVGDQGVNTLVANLEQVTALIVKNFTETYIKSLWLITHKYLKLYFPEELSAKMGGQWSATNPSEWQDRDNLSVLLPPSRSEKIVQQVALEKMIVTATMELQQGGEGITTSKEDLYQMKLDHARLSGINNPEKYLVNPASPQAQQAQQMQAQQQQQQMMQQQQAMEEEKAYQRMIQQKQLGLAESEVMRNYQDDVANIKFKYDELARKSEVDVYKANLSAEVDEAKIVGSATQAIEVQAMQNRNNIAEEVVDGDA